MKSLEAIEANEGIWYYWGHFEDNEAIDTDEAIEASWGQWGQWDHFSVHWCQWGQTGQLSHWGQWGHTRSVGQFEVNFEVNEVIDANETIDAMWGTLRAEANEAIEAIEAILRAMRPFRGWVKLVVNFQMSDIDTRNHSKRNFSKIVQQHELLCSLCINTRCSSLIRMDWLVPEHSVPSYK